MAGNTINSPYDFYRRAKNLRPSSYIAETFARVGAGTGSQAILASGRESIQAVFLEESLTVASLTFVSGGTAAATPTHQFFTLRDANRNLLAVTTDDTTTAWAANTVKTLTLASSYTVPNDGVYFVGVVVVATTVPSLAGVTINPALGALLPLLCGWDSVNTGLTTPSSLPAQITSVAAASSQIYGLLA